MHVKRIKTIQIAFWVAMGLLTAAALAFVLRIQPGAATRVLAAMGRVPAGRWWVIAGGWRPST